MKNIFKYTLLLIIFLVITGCAGAGDYEYDLVNDYKLHRSSAHSVFISPNAICVPATDGPCEDREIPTKIVELAWNENYVIAKQFGMKNKNDYEGDEYQIPDENQVYYWILDTVNKKKYGPFDLEEFNEQLKTYELMDLELKPVESYLK